jgi:hypothetical protein
VISTRAPSRRAAQVWGTPGLNANAFMLAVACFGLTALLFVSGHWGMRLRKPTAGCAASRAGRHQRPPTALTTPPPHPTPSPVGPSLQGTWVERNGPWASVMVTLFLTPGGWALGALGAYLQSLPLVIAGFGILHGIGAAMTYISVTSCLQRWFLDLKGLGAWWEGWRRQ